MFRRMSFKLQNILSKILRYSRSAEYSRRYFTISAFDSAVTVWGIILGINILGTREVSQIVSGGIGAILAMAISGMGFTYVAESAEQERRIKEIEEAMLINIEDTEIKNAHRKAAIMSALVDSASSCVAGLLVLSPYMFTLLRIIEGDLAFILSTTIIFTLLFTLGMYLGKLSRRSLILSGIKSMGIGGAVIIAFLLINLIT